MKTYYTGRESHSPQQPVAIDAVPRSESAEGYSADGKLATAVNVALILGKPLILTGEPGTGKTRLAEHVAMALGLPQPERFDTKSNSQAVELFYRFDSLARFQSAHAGEKDKRALDFISFGPLGRAILKTRQAADPLFATLNIPHPSGSTAAAARSVVLVDEIDKAPRDFPNDLLDAIDNLRFSIRELEPSLQKQMLASLKTIDIDADEALRPVVIMTSNSEKNLPDPFLRRCVYFHIEFPTRERLLQIVAARIAGGGLRPAGSGSAAGAASPEPLTATQLQESKLLTSATDFFLALRRADLRKRPATAELIDWIRLLSQDLKFDQTIREHSALVRRTLGVLVKSMEDLSTADSLAERL